MAFCSNCGKELANGAKFCYECGTRVLFDENTASNQRRTEYDGIIHKCPNCGDILDAYESVCKACGYEQRGTKATGSVRELAAKLEAIEATRETKHFSFILKGLTKTDEQKISLIRSFAIPNTKEDLHEFLILSYSNINVSSYENDGWNQAAVAVSDAWLAKFEQAYQKAKILFPEDPHFLEIQKLYSSIHKQIKRARTKTWRLLGVVFGSLFAFFVMVAVIAIISSSNDTKEEIRRLEVIEQTVIEALASKDYKYALMNATLLDFDGTDTGFDRDWKIKQSYWIDVTIEEAAKNGIVLERPVVEEGSTEG